MSDIVVEVNANYIIILQYFCGLDVDQLMESYQYFKLLGILHYLHVVMLGKFMGSCDILLLSNDILKMPTVMYTCDL